MTEPTQHAPKPTPPKSPFWVDFGPILIFVVLFQVMRRGDNPDMAIYWATGASMAAIFIALIYSKFVIKHISGQLWLTAALLIGMGALTIGFKNDTFIKLKPTILNIGFAGAIFAGLAMGKNPIKLLMGAAFEMPADKWKVLALRWAYYFLAMAALNVVIWKGFSENFWVNFKLLGFMPLSFAFIISQMPFIMKHSNLKDAMKDKD
ncbi:MAG: inner membrane-spanning protein YciB [Robiginitomaculum sp.]